MYKEHKGHRRAIWINQDSDRKYSEFYQAAFTNLRGAGFRLRSKKKACVERHKNFLQCEHFFLPLQLQYHLEKIKKKCGFPLSTNGVWVMGCLLTVVRDLSGCAAAAASSTPGSDCWQSVIEVEWLIVWFYKYLRSWTKHRIRQALHPLGLVLCVPPLQSS